MCVFHFYTHITICYYYLRLLHSLSNANITNKLLILFNVCCKKKPITFKMSDKMKMKLTSV